MISKSGRIQYRKNLKNTKKEYSTEKYRKIQKNTNNCNLFPKQSQIKTYKTENINKKSCEESSS